MILPNNRRGQITIFVIIAIVFVGIITLYFVFRGIDLPEAGVSIEENPIAFMQSCIEEDLASITGLLLAQGGFINPLNYKLYDDKKVTYLCYNSGRYESCINQHPMLITEINKEIENKITPVVEECFIDLEENFKEKGLEVNLVPRLGLGVSLGPDKIFINIEKDLTISKADETVNYKGMELGLRSSLYDLSHVAARIVNNEAKFCYFERQGYMNLHPEYTILFDTLSDSTKIYTIQDTDTKEEMNIAIRGCAIS